ncbi:MAG TPA: pyrrolo-quinoline quinone [Candidatus Limnocylindria bacterium]|nr:pyrrolo-quinoline quinone [Candidatus Limnocylindria bacterium]
MINLVRGSRNEPAAFCEALACCAALALFVVSFAARADHDVLTYRYNLNRDGANTNETILSPLNVGSTTFGRLFSCPVDGFLYAQPLYLSNVEIPGQGFHNVVYAATENNTVYAYDADSAGGTNAVPLWVRTFNQTGVTSVPISDYGLSDRPATQLGITGTPVIDRDSGTLYVVAKIKDVRSGAAQYSNQLYALDVATGEPKFGSPVVITNTYPGIGSGNNGAGKVLFHPFYNFQRPGLLLLNGVVYVGFGSVGDQGPYHGWFFGYDAHTLQLVRTFNATPNGYQGGIWMAGSAPAADDKGFIYLATGNGSFSVDKSGVDYGDSIIKLQPTPNAFSVVDYFTPSDQNILVGVDGDLGSGGVVLFPAWAGSGNHPHLLGLIGKDATLYLCDRENMGRYNSFNDSQIVQSLPGLAPSLSTPAAFNGRFYHSGLNAPVKSYAIAGAKVPVNPTSQSTMAIGSPGSIPTVSANGSGDGIVWVIQADAFNYGGPAILRAFDATDLSRELYNSALAGVRDRLPVGMKFSVPIVANGKVYVGTGAGVVVFGLLNGTAAAPPGIGIDQSARIVISGVVGGSYSVQYATDLSLGSRAWTTFATVTLSRSSQTVTDPNGNSGSARFYRAIVGTGSE